MWRVLVQQIPDYFWLGLGKSTVINARLGTPDATITSDDLKFHYSFGNFAHVARNPEAMPFDNITVELLEPQTDVHNLCETALADKPLDCKKAAMVSNGLTEHPALATAQLRVSLATIGPEAELRAFGHGKPGWVIALDTLDVRKTLAIEGGGRWVGGVYRGPSAVKNTGRTPLKVVVVRKER